MSMDSKRTAVLYLMAVFIAGGIFGFAVNEFRYAVTAEAKADDKPASVEYRKRLVEDLDRRLNLDNDQEAEVLGILDDVCIRFQSVRDAMEPEFEAIRMERTDRIMSVLTPSQRVKYQQIVEERDRRAREVRERNRAEIQKSSR